MKLEIWVWCIRWDRWIRLARKCTIGIFSGSRAEDFARWEQAEWHSLASGQDSGFTANMELNSWSYQDISVDWRLTFKTGFVATSSEAWGADEGVRLLSFFFFLFYGHTFKHLNEINRFSEFCLPFSKLGCFYCLKSAGLFSRFAESQSAQNQVVYL